MERQTGRLPYRARFARRLLVKAAVTAAGAVVLAAAVLAPAAPAAARMVFRLAAAVHALGRRADQVPANAPAAAAAAVGALFTTTGGRLASHFCTASVLDSPAGDLVMTAAHCLSGLAPSQFLFVPGY